jgi:hypothetical protein
MNFLGDLILDAVVQFVLRIVVLPILLISATPFILVAALFYTEPYCAGIKTHYARLLEFWSGLGEYLAY